MSDSDNTLAKSFEPQDVEGGAVLVEAKGAHGSPLVDL